ncbi:hypothetical protein POM88_050062 [Heracleum sosnowskyi]|uniref:Helicase ATP-binding domain-containing protein n=1 Tax=Heracleum sosnowskyi TaxID=360622 RepID=A0AAD8M146_9APIA|nr:hypothetical protein POM88_050062 [Heracleum sosnowskyi]
MLVLDEANKLLSPKFQPSVEELIDYLPQTRQILMFSATFPVTVKVTSTQIHCWVDCKPYYQLLRGLDDILPSCLWFEWWRTVTFSFTPTQFLRYKHCSGNRSMKFKKAIIACAFTEKDYQKAASTASRVLQMAFVLSVGLALVIGLGLQYGCVVFTRDKHVLRIIAIGVPFVAATQPINYLAFAFDGLYYGVSDFAYSAYSMLHSHLVMDAYVSMVYSI